MTKEERKDMCDAHYGMVEIVVDELLARERNRKYKPYREDIFGIACVELVKASEKFDASKGFQFSTYASNAMRYAMIRHFKKLDKQHTTEVCIDDLLGTDEEPTTSLKDGVYIDREDSAFIKRFEPKDPLHKIVYHEVILGGKSFRQLSRELVTEKDRKIYKIKQRILTNIRKALEGDIKYEKYR